MHDFLRYTVLGLVVGSGYAVAASGLVVTYQTSGIFNFAHGAIGMFMAFVYWKIHVDAGVPTLLALALVLFVLAPPLGVLILTLLVLNCLAAAMLGRLKSLPLTFLGAILVALGENYIVGYGPGNVGSYRGALPSIFLLLVLLFLPQARLKSGRIVGTRAPRVPSFRQSLISAGVFVIVGMVVSTGMSRSDLATYGGGLAIALIMLSLV